MQGLIIENISNLYKIKVDNKIYEANARGRLKKEEITPVVGDKVEIQILDEENNKAIIENLYREDIGSSIKLCDDATYTKIVASDEFMMMPVYPCYGSIKIIDEVCIVKLEENPPLPSSN